MSNLQVCPQCGWDLHRSRSRGLREKVIKTFSSHRAYRCHECGWRGWVKENVDARRFSGRRRALKLILTLLVTGAVILIALFAGWGR